MYNYCTQTHNQNLFHSQEIYFVFIRHFSSAAAFKSVNKLAPYFAGVHEILKNFLRFQCGSSTKSLLDPGTVFSCFSVKLVDPQREHWTMLAEHTTIRDLVFNTKAVWTYWSRTYRNLSVSSTLFLFTACQVAKATELLCCWNNRKSNEEKAGKTQTKSVHPETYQMEKLSLQKPTFKRFVANVHYFLFLLSSFPPYFFSSL